MVTFKAIAQNFHFVIVILCLLLLEACGDSSGATITRFEDAKAMVADAKTGINIISIEDFNTMQEAEEWYTLIDVREEPEHDAGYIPGTVLIPRGVLEFRILNESFWEDEGMYLPELEDKIIVYCRSGNRSALAVQSLQSLGFKNVYSLDGGFNQWKADYPEKTEKNIKKEIIPVAPSPKTEEDPGTC